MNPHRIPAALFAIVALVLLYFLFAGPDRTIDLHLHDTFLVIGSPALYAVPAVLCLFFGIVYALAGRILLSRWLSWLHLLTTLAFLAALSYHAHPAGAAGDAAPLGWKGYWSGSSFEGLVLAFLVGQALFLVNVLGGALRALFGRR